jgi:hypothetical protein
LLRELFRWHKFGVLWRPFAEGKFRRQRNHSGGNFREAKGARSNLRRLLPSVPESQIGFAGDQPIIPEEPTPATTSNRGKRAKVEAKDQLVTA